MDIEKILTLVAIVVYGLVNIVLSVVRTLKTSKISSEVKAVLPQNDDVPPSDDVPLSDDVQPVDDGKPINDVQDVQKLSIDDVLSVISEFLNHNR